MVYLAEKLSHHVQKLVYEDLSVDTIKNAKYRVLDTIAVALAGFRKRIGQKRFLNIVSV